MVFFVFFFFFTNCFGQKRIWFLSQHPLMKTEKQKTLTYCPSAYNTSCESFSKHFILMGAAHEWTFL